MGSEKWRSYPEKFPFSVTRTSNLRDEKGVGVDFFATPLPSNLHSRKPKYFCLSHLFQEKIEKGKETFNYNSSRREQRNFYLFPPFCQEWLTSRFWNFQEITPSSPVFPPVVSESWNFCEDSFVLGAEWGLSRVGICGQVVKFRHFKSTRRNCCIYSRDN